MKILLLDALVFGSVHTTTKFIQLLFGSAFGMSTKLFLNYSRYFSRSFSVHLFWFHSQTFKNNSPFHFVLIIIQKDGLFLDCRFASPTLKTCSTKLFILKYEFQRKSFRKRKARLLFCLHFKHLFWISAINFHVGNSWTEENSRL